MEEDLMNHKDTVQIIAEVANSHEGSFQTVQKITKRAAKTGVKIIKYQKYYAEELYIDHHPKYEHFKRLEFSYNQWKKLINLAKSCKLLVYCDVFGIKSAREMIELDIDGYKIHSSDLTNFPLIRLLASNSKPILLSCGGATLIEIHEALEEIRNVGKQDVVLMHGFQGFPTDTKDINLNRIDFLYKTFNLPVGFADHTDANSDFTYIIPTLSVFKNVRFIEKHVTLNRNKKGIDYYSSLEPKELKKLNYFLGETLKALGESSNVWSINEQTYRKKMKKMLVAAHDLKDSNVITEQNTAFKRCDVDDNIFSLNQNDALGKKVLKSISKDELIRNSKLENKIGILIAARVNSQRLPKKALLEICGKKTIEHLIERTKLSKRANIICLCTTTEPEDNILINIAQNHGIKWLRGSKDNVLMRFVEAIDREDLDVVIRITGDDILLDPVHLDKAIDYLLETNAEYTHNKKLPLGTECEVFLASTLKKIYKYAENSEQTEYLTYYVSDNQFNKNECPINDRYSKSYHLSLDTYKDYETIKTILENFYSPTNPYTLDDILSFLNKHPDLFQICNTKVKRNDHGFKINTKLRFD